MTLVNELDTQGFIFLQGRFSNRSSLAIAQSIGKIYEAATVPMVQALVPKTDTESEQSSYSGNYGLRGFPLHTDLAHWHVPPKYLLLKCVRGDKSVTTDVVDMAQVTDTISHLPLRRALYRPRRKLDGKMFLLRLMHNGIFRWDRLFLRPANQSAEDLTPMLENALLQAPRTQLRLENAGDILLINNWKMLHGRSAVSASSTRLIERVYLSEVTA